MNSQNYSQNAAFRQTSPLIFAQYQTMYEQSIHDPNTFWAEQAKTYPASMKQLIEVVKHA